MNEIAPFFILWLKPPNSLWRGGSATHEEDPLLLTIAIATSVVYVMLIKPSDLLLVIVHFYFSLTVLVVLIVHLWSDNLRPLIVYGKTSSTLEHRQFSGFITTLASWSVPRSWFKHFYIVSSTTGFMILMAYKCLEPIGRLNAALFLTHSLRRTLETVFIDRPSGSTMWIGHYLVGLMFYVFTNLAMVAEHIVDTDQHVVPRPSYGTILSGLCLITFFAAQVGQHSVHRLLASYRAQCTPGQYLNPQDGLFRYLIAPHYTAEIVMYFALALMNGENLCLYWVVLWTFLTLTTSALETDAWGKKTFSDWGNRWVILPGLL